jgi:hypothetical protein
MGDIVSGRRTLALHSFKEEAVLAHEVRSTLPWGVCLKEAQP